MTQKKTRDSKKRIAFPIQLFQEQASSFAELPDEIQVVPTGTWDHPMYGEMKIGPTEIAKFVENFKAKVRLDLPITAGHDNGMSGGELPAIAWFTDLIDRGVNGLYAVVKWTAEGQKLLTEGAFKYFSPEFYEQYEDPETRQKYDYVLVGGALTNKPYFKELEPVIAFSEPRLINKKEKFNESMTLNLKDIVAKKPEELNDEEKAFLVDHKSELSAEESEAFKSVVGEAPESDEAKAAREEKEKGDANEAAGLNRDGSPKEPVNASEKKDVKISASELATLRALAEKGGQALEKIEASERTALVKELTFSSTNSEGRFLPKQEGALGSFLKSLSETQRNTFVTLIKAMPKANSQEFKEIGDAGGSVARATQTEVENAVKEKISASEKAGSKMSYADALKAVFAENVDLAKRYNEAMASGEVSA